MADEIIAEYGDSLDRITLLRGSKGMFEVTVDGNLLYSKSATKRHPNPGEVVGAIAEVTAK